MTNQAFILLLKEKFKRYFEGESMMNLNIDQLIEHFREEAIADHEAGKETKVTQAFEDLKAAIILEFYHDYKKKNKKTTR